MPDDSRKVADAFSRAAKTYDSSARIQRLVLEECATRLSTLLPVRCDVLDLGCGTGYLAQLPAGKNWRLIGIDMAIGMCQQALRQMPVVNAHAEALPFANATFHGAVCSLVLQWANEPQRLLREMARVVKPGGVCGLVALGPKTLQELKRAFATIDDDAHVNDFMSPQQLDAWLHAADFDVKASRTISVALDYADVQSLMAEIKRIGANHVPTRRPGLNTPSMLSRLESAYPGNENGIAATWDVMYRFVERRITSAGSSRGA
jgi:malonyl-CoA O-methyltransferase